MLALEPDGNVQLTVNAPMEALESNLERLTELLESQERNEVACWETTFSLLSTSVDRSKQSGVLLWRASRHRLASLLRRALVVDVITPQQLVCCERWLEECDQDEPAVTPKAPKHADVLAYWSIGVSNSEREIHSLESTLDTAWTAHFTAACELDVPSPEHQQKQEETIERLQALLGPIASHTSLAVFGSSASGMHTPRSDLDLGIINSLPGEGLRILTSLADELKRILNPHKHTHRYAHTHTQIYTYTHTHTHTHTRTRIRTHIYIYIYT
jgi:predicted nucleotidyltransferase